MLDDKCSILRQVATGAAPDMRLAITKLPSNSLVCDEYLPALRQYVGGKAVRWTKRAGLHHSALGDRAGRADQRRRRPGIVAAVALRRQLGPLLRDA
jgi:hypothetical protein